MCVMWGSCRVCSNIQEDWMIPANPKVMLTITYIFICTNIAITSNEVVGCRAAAQVFVFVSVLSECLPPKVY